MLFHSIKITVLDTSIFYLYCYFAFDVPMALLHYNIDKYIKEGPWLFLRALFFFLLVLASTNALICHWYVERPLEDVVYLYIQLGWQRIMMIA